MATNGGDAPRFPGRSAAILAGGKSTRMGVNKALLEIGGLGILKRTATLLRPLVDDLFVVADDPSPYAGLALPVRPDVLRGRGALGGIHAAITQAVHPLVLCVACDMPRITARVLALLLETADPRDDALLPLARGLPEPLLAVYGRGALAGIERSLSHGQLKIMDALAGLRVRHVDEGTLRQVDPSLDSFVNVNTPRELAAARAAAEGRA